MSARAIAGLLEESDSLLEAEKRLTILTEALGPERARVALDALAEYHARMVALSTPGPARDAVLERRPRKADRPRCGATLPNGKPCRAAVTCYRAINGRIVTLERCRRHGGVPR